MTCSVGVTDGTRIVLGGDTAGAGEREIYSLKNSKVFVAGSYAVGYTTSYRMGQILRYGTELPEPPSTDLERFLAMDFVAAIRAAFEAGGFDGSLSQPGSILVGVRGRLFCIGAEYQVTEEATPYAAVGDGRLPAYGALFALEGSEKSLRERAEIALRAAQRLTPSVREPFSFVEVGDGVEITIQSDTHG